MKHRFPVLTKINTCTVTTGTRINLTDSTLMFTFTQGGRHRQI
uniref:Uncharacterized protein n=1 Tax=Setaria viridis TaxID=4556 RepID=A0A4U6TPP5_SETVI|nr:hypothetical protein SEVIR_7G120250v2 [Setaria viridis]